MAGQSGNGGMRLVGTGRRLYSSPAKRTPIGEMLVDAGLIEQHHLDKALAVQAQKGGKLVAILISLGFFAPGPFVDFLAKQPGVASLDLSNYEVPRELVALVPREYAIRHEVFPIDRLGKLLTLGMVCPLDAVTISELEHATGLRVKPILCSSQDIRQAIERYYPKDEDGAERVAGSPSDLPLPLQRLETSLRLGNVLNLVRGVEALPTLPETVERVRRAMTDPDTSVEDLARIITMDPPIAARVLRVANSAAYGFPNRIASLRLAVSLLGLRETYSLVLTAAIVDRYSKSARFDYRRFWLHSMKCAAAANVIADACGLVKHNSIAAAALLHDIGRIALLEVVPDLFLKIDEHLSGQALVAAEEEAFGIAHPEAGYELAIRWNLPDEIAQAIRFHHMPEKAPQAQEVVCIVAAADVMQRLATGQEPPPPELVAELGERLVTLGLEQDAADSLLRRYVEQQSLSTQSGHFW